MPVRQRSCRGGHHRAVRAQPRVRLYAVLEARRGLVRPDRRGAARQGSREQERRQAKIINPNALIIRHACRACGVHMQGPVERPDHPSPGWSSSTPSARQAWRMISALGLMMLSLSPFLLTRTLSRGAAGDLGEQGPFRLPALRAAANVVVRALPGDDHLDRIGGAQAAQRASCEILGGRLHSLVDSRVNRNLSHGGAPARQEPWVAAWIAQCFVMGQFDRNRLRSNRL